MWKKQKRKPNKTTKNISFEEKIDSQSSGSIAAKANKVKQFNEKN